MKIEISEENFKFKHENLNGKLDVLPILYPIFQVSFYTALENNTFFLNQFFFGFEVESSHLPSEGRPCPQSLM